MAFHPKKRFGQNFLRDPGVVQRILTAADLQSEDRVIEIGPGMGVLTERLVEKAAAVTAIEVDRELGAFLENRQFPNFTLIQADAVRLDWDQLLARPPYKLVANLPYQITSPVLFHALNFRDRFDRLVLMMQREVARRLRAVPGTKEYGILSVLCPLWFDIQIVAEVPPQAFSPKPKVFSTVLSFLARDRPLVEVHDERFFRRVVKAAFGQRRKTLRNALGGAGFEDGDVENAFLATGLDPRRRGETLSLEEFSLLSRELDRS